MSTPNDLMCHALGVRPPARARGYQRGPHLCKRPGRPSWYARGGVLGDQPISLHTTDAAEAERRLGALVGERTAGRRARAAGAPPPETALDLALTAWAESPHGYTRRTLQTLDNRIAAWVAWCAERGVTLASQVTPALVDRWLTERGKVASRRTINRDLRAVRVCLRWAAERGLVPPCPAVVDRAELREPVRHRRREVPDPAELARVLEAVACGSLDSACFSGGEGIRTPGGLPPTAVFKTVADRAKTAAIEALRAT